MNFIQRAGPDVEHIGSEAMARFPDALAAIFPPDGNPDTPCSAAPSRRRLWRSGNLWVGSPSGVWRGYNGGRIHGFGYGFVSLAAWARREPPQIAALALAEALGIDSTGERR